MTHLTHANSLALARIRLGLDRVVPGWSCRCFYCSNAGEVFARVWAPNGALTAIGFCCVLYVAGALLERVTWQEYKQHKAACGVTDGLMAGRAPCTLGVASCSFWKQCKVGCMRWRNWFLNSVPPSYVPLAALLLQRKSTHVVSKS